MSIRDDITASMKTAMKAGDTARLSAVRLIMAKLKDADIAARPKGVERISDDEVLAMLRGMIKPRREAIDLYEKGNRPELAAKEQSEILVIESFLPQALNEDEMQAAVAEAVTETGATGVKDMGRVMAALKTKHGAALDMARIGAIVKTALAG
ncbi:GatB/YqeY domain-containing protein [Acidisoma cellulosilytica]|uniref:GatB/YqeY domain-containing protein n=1 Tax=Acidisoma cellulosilyticum TaxID=2802395 RepID=A0A963Z0U8_9PROT|nr:GatB/YqeY domain-containing protein [Acidisoma cellulosilyticum]MCB8880449.1 GatB/YqeY domain-containing protein [Acidisoma cellulosilyticum]